MDNYIVCSDGIIHTGLDRAEALRRLSVSAPSETAANDCFGDILNDILEHRLVSAQDISSALDRLSAPPDRFSCFLVAKTTADISQGSLPDALEKFFPGAPVTQRGGFVVVLLSRPDRAARLYPDFDDAALEALLAEHGAFAAIGTASSRRDNLCTSYYLVMRAFELGERLRIGKSRVFLFEDYAEYIMIDMCSIAFSGQLGEGDLVSLTHPAVVRLYRYDLEHHENLVEILYHYCMCDCNVAKTAAAAYMHRNTIAAKLVRIRSLLDLDLSDGRLQQRIIFSYQVLRYMERYRKTSLAAYIRPE